MKTTNHYAIRNTWCMSASCFSSRYFLFRNPAPVVIARCGALTTGFKTKSGMEFSSSSSPMTKTNHVDSDWQTYGDSQFKAEGKHNPRLGLVTINLNITLLQCSLIDAIGLRQNYCTHKNLDFNTNPTNESVRCSNKTYHRSCSDTCSWQYTGRHCGPRTHQHELMEHMPVTQRPSTSRSGLVDSICLQLSSFSLPAFLLLPS